MKPNATVRFLSTALLAFACSDGAGEDANAESSVISSATAAIRVLEAQDTEVIDRCEAAVERCRSSRSDAGATPVCESRLNRCEDLAQGLADVRRPAVECWQQIKACAETEAPGERCATAAQACETLVDEVSRERANACEARLERCLERDSSQTSAVACDNMQEACERVAEHKAERDSRRAQHRAEQADTRLRDGDRGPDPMHSLDEVIDEHDDDRLSRDGTRGNMRGDDAADAGSASDDAFDTSDESDKE